MPQGHPGQLLCWDRGLHHLCSKRGKCAYALSQCTQQGEAHPIYLVVYFGWLEGNGLVMTGHQKLVEKPSGFHIWTLRSPEQRYNWLR